MADSNDRVGVGRAGGPDGSTGVSLDFDAVYRANQPKLVDYANRHGARDAESLADMAMWDLYQARDRLRSTDAPVIRAYLYRALRNHLVRERSRSKEEPTADIEQVATGRDGHFEDLLLDGMQLETYLTELTDDQREVLRLRYYESLSSNESAEVLGRSPISVRTQQHRGIARLRQIAFAATMAAVVVCSALAVRWLVQVQDDGVEMDAPATESEDRTSLDGGPSRPATDRDSNTPTVEVEVGLDSPPITASAPTSAPTSGTAEPATDSDATTTSQLPGSAESTRSSEPTGVIRLAGSDSCLASTTSFLVLTPCDGAAGQNWTARVIEDGDGATRLFENAGAGCLDVSVGKTEAGTRVLRHACHGRPHQLWVLERAPGSSDAVLFRNPQANRCLEVDVDAVSDRSVTFIGDCDGNNSQRWLFEVAGP